MGSFPAVLGGFPAGPRARGVWPCPVLLWGRGGYTPASPLPLPHTHLDSDAECRALPMSSGWAQQQQCPSLEPARVSRPQGARGRGRTWCQGRRRPSRPGSRVLAPQVRVLDPPDPPDGVVLGSPGFRSHRPGSRGCRGVGRAQGGWSLEASRVASFCFPSCRLVQCPSLLLRGCLDVVVVQLSGHLPSAPNPSQPECGWDPWRQMGRGISPQAHPPAGPSQGWPRPVPRGHSRARAAWVLGSGGGVLGGGQGWTRCEPVSGRQR